MSWTSPLTVASTMRAFPGLPLDALHVRLEVGNRRFHHLGGLQHEGQLHLDRSRRAPPRSSSRTTGRLVHDRRAVRGISRRGPRRDPRLETLALTVDDAVAPAARPEAERRARHGLSWSRPDDAPVTPSMTSRKRVQRIRDGLGAPVVDRGPWRTCELVRPGFRSRSGMILRRVHDCAWSCPALAALVQEDAVEDGVGPRGCSPKLTLDRPSDGLDVQWMARGSWLADAPRCVAIAVASLRTSSWPVARVKVRVIDHDRGLAPAPGFSGCSVESIRRSGDGLTLSLGGFRAMPTLVDRTGPPLPLRASRPKRWAGSWPSATPAPSPSSKLIAVDHRPGRRCSSSAAVDHRRLRWSRPRSAGFTLAVASPPHRPRACRTTLVAADDSQRRRR